MSKLRFDPTDLLVGVLVWGLSFPVAAQTLGQGLDPFPKALASASPRATPSSLNATSGLPVRVDLSEFLPPIRSQGAVGSCAAWATIYYARTLLEKKERGWDVSIPNHQLAPLYTYNQLTQGRNEGTSITSHMAMLKTQGIVPFADFPFVDNLARQPDETLRKKALELRISDYKSLPRRKGEMDLDAVKAFLAQGLPVVAGFQLFEDFHRYQGGVYRTTSGPTKGGHAMAIVGYDDEKGALRIVNSWGSQWGEKGSLWLSYESVSAMTKVDYGCAVMFDQVETSSLPSPTGLSASRGEHQESISLSWQKPAGAGQFVVLRADNATHEWKEIARTPNAFYEDAPLPPGVSYVYSVRAESLDGMVRLSPLSPLAEGSTRRKDSVPGTVRGLSATLEGKGANLRWLPLEDVETFAIYRFDRDVGNFVLVATVREESYFDESAFRAGSEAVWIVHGVNAQGAGQPSPSVTLIGLPPPSPQTTKLPPSSPMVLYEGSYLDENWFDPLFVDKALKQFAEREKAAFDAWKKSDQEEYEFFLQGERL